MGIGGAMSNISLTVGVYDKFADHFVENLKEQAANKECVESFEEEDVKSDIYEALLKTAGKGIEVYAKGSNNFYGGLVAEGMLLFVGGFYSDSSSLNDFSPILKQSSKSLFEKIPNALVEKSLMKQLDFPESAKDKAEKLIFKHYQALKGNKSIVSDVAFTHNDKFSNIVKSFNKSNWSTEVFKSTLGASAKQFGAAFGVNIIFNVVFDVVGDFLKGEKIKVDVGTQIYKGGIMTVAGILGKFAKVALPGPVGTAVNVGLSMAGTFVAEWTVKQFETEWGRGVAGVAIVAGATVGMAVAIALCSNPVGWAALGVIAIAAGCAALAGLIVWGVEKLVVNYLPAAWKAAKQTFNDIVDSGKALFDWGARTFGKFKAIFA